MFTPIGKLDQKEILECWEFAYQKSCKNKTRSVKNDFGSSYLRKDTEIFIDVFGGKLAEYAIAKELNKIYPCRKPNMLVLETSSCDDGCDLVFNNKIISCKTSKKNSKLLLLEVSRYNNNGEYLIKGTPVHIDEFIICRVNYIDGLPRIGSYKNLKSIEYDTPRVLSKEMFKEGIKNNSIMNKGSLLGKIAMRVNNYYFNIDSLPTINNYY